ncbi:TIGR00730 family Rossman fold protein [Actinokineospora globicatena]|uniref:Cytokinin riboside 5'-monophosphate phosphoribohydrolase n=1 Tax=Actinokineospora globicatena TaxID=103729 RepID=A0A9W6QJ59_9PSEU|nr:TIGR00730 family Rossman fold protein [Actinokineospora globicatena]GLW89650.1 putative cytokinin riboside 5'-monophosphate phosphoribohydrolase [Actinokineospora globicatena]
MRVTVYAGSAPGDSPVFADEVGRFVAELAGRGTEFVYGGGSTGLMGVVADRALAEGGKVIGVIPRELVDAEIAHPGLTELHVVPTMHERKQLLAELGDAIVAVPGGVGTLEELFEVWAALILGHHRKPLVLLNIDGYWDPLVDVVVRMAGRGFLREAERGSLVSVTDAAGFEEAVRAWTPPPPRWPAPDATQAPQAQQSRGEDLG